ncbi:MAG: hypothetical protein ACRBN8_10985 [Nannocystales bacterium]
MFTSGRRLLQLRTQFWDRASSFELRLLAVRRDGTPDERAPTEPGYMIDADDRGDRAAVVVRLGDQSVRVLVVDTSGTDGLAG